VLLEGTDFGIRYTDDFRRPMQDAFYPRSVELEGFERWRRYESFNVLDDTWYPDKPFRHRTRPGDSGSPVFWPIADGKWAIGHEMISGNIWRPAAINALIAHANASLGITEEYTVTVAPDPLATSPSVPTNAFRDGGNNPVVDAAGAYLCPA
jgi:hypothetical protein